MLMSPIVEKLKNLEDPGHSILLSSQPFAMSLNFSKDFGMTKSTQSLTSRNSSLVSWPRESSSLSNDLQALRSKNLRFERLPICLGNVVSFLQDLKSNIQSCFKSQKLSGSCVMFLHLSIRRSSNFCHRPIVEGIRVSPMHLLREISTKLVKLPMELGSSLTALHSLIRRTCKLERSPIDSGKSSSSLHLSRHKYSRLVNFPRLLGRDLRTLFPDPCCPPIESLRKLKPNVER